ncbi:hypothetical protein [Catenuloplanes japonicus]|uniref:hypothetical protein n=1 Tax=Catenuloplanes japonicus TaxID=33876 RepID=UPI00052665CA|nr:hypothetical protein [Catenuloplanes japonicus]
MIDWFNSHAWHIAAIIAGFGIRWFAMQFLATATKASLRAGAGRAGQPGTGQAGGTATATKSKKWNKLRVIKTMTLALVVASGLALAYGTIPAAQWVISWGSGFGGIVAAIFGVLSVVAGWRAIESGAQLVHDLSDGTPDDAAFNAGFWIPTLVPIGWAAIVALFTSAEGVTNLVSAIIISAITIFYGHRILKQAHNAAGHKPLWMYYAFIVSIFIGLVHIVAFAYIDTGIAAYLGSGLLIILRVVFAVTAIGFLIAGAGDWIRDFIPEKWSQWAAMYAIPILFVLPQAVYADIQNRGQDTITVIFGAFS